MTNSTGAERIPKNYRLVYEIVHEQGTGAHATTQEIFARARERAPGIGYSTVYRALDRLRDLGLILEVQVPGGASALYEPARSDHAHFVCRRCGLVEDVDYALPPSFVADLERRRGFGVSDVSLTLEGVCARCRSREEETAAALAGEDPSLPRPE